MKKFDKLVAKLNNKEVSKEDIDKGRKKYFKKLFDTQIKNFFEMEAFEYFPSDKYVFIMKFVYPQVLELIEKYGDDHITLRSISNMGYLLRSYTFDKYSREPKGTDFKGEIFISVCPCGTNLIASKVKKTYLPKEKKWDSENISLVEGGCHKNELWDLFKLEKNEGV